MQLESSNWTVSCRFSGSPSWLDFFKVNCGGKGTSVYSPCRSRFQTISTAKLATSEGKLYCLEWSDHTSTLAAAPCSPSSDPAVNDAPQQQWEVVTDDNRVHPYGRPGWCLTNAVYDQPSNSSFGFTVELLPCDGRVQQSWGYGGNGAGLVYGSVNLLGLI